MRPPSRHAHRRCIGLQDLSFEWPLWPHEVHYLPEDLISRFEFAFLPEGCHTGDAARSELRYALTHPIIFRLSQERRLELSREQIEDIIQETFLALRRKRVVPFYRERGDFSAYLRGNMVNARKAIRSQYREMGGLTLPLEELKHLALSKDRFSDLKSGEMARLILDGVPDRICEACLRILAENTVRTILDQDIGITGFRLARKSQALRLRALQIAA